MECYNCHKKFDYDKYYGICPKCGCFNQKESREERHEDLHDRFGGDSNDTGEDCGQLQSSLSCADTQASTGGTEETYVQSESKRQGTGLLVFSIFFLILGLAVLASGIIFSIARGGEKTLGETDDTFQMLVHEAGESFAFQQGTLQVTEARILADRDTLPKLEENMELIAVHVIGQGDGEYEDYNRILAPYIETDGVYRCALSAYDFEPYGQMLGASPVLDEYALMGENSCDGWYGFLTEEGTTDIRIWFDEYDGSDWDGGKLLASHGVELTLDHPVAEEGGDPYGQ